jgi:PIN domain nuclease of toxin-antitoxin system
MNLLLDSHALLWALSAPEKLSATARAAIEDGNNPVFFSSASIWELAIKSAKGQLEIKGNLLLAAESANFIELPVRSNHAWAVRSLPTIHSDPFDRILAAQAEIERLTLVTRDQFLEKYSIRVLPA